MRTRRFIFALSIGMVLYGLGPYFYGYFFRPEGYYFTWLSPFSTRDTSVYFSYLYQIIAGRSTLLNLYTTEGPQAGVFNIFWFAVGFVSRLLHLTPLVGYHASRLLLIPLAVSMVGVWACLACSSFRQRAWAVALALFGGGFGGYLVAAESIPALAFMHSPHFVASYFFLLLTLFLVYRGIERHSLRWLAIAGGVGGIFVLFHPYYVIPVVLIAVLYLTYEVWVGQYSLAGALKMLAAFLPFLTLAALFYVAILHRDSVFADAVAQNYTPLRSILWTALSYFPLLFGAVLAIRIAWRPRGETPIARFLAIWIIVDVLLMFSGSRFARRFSEGLTIPLALLTMMAWNRATLVSYLRKAYPALMVVLFSLLYGVSPLIYTLRAYQYKNDPTLASLLYIDEDRRRVFQQLSAYPLGTARVLSGLANSNLIPAFTGQYALAGHLAETIQFQQKQALIEALLTGGFSQYNEAVWLCKPGVTHLLYSKEEQRDNFDLSAKAYLKPVFRAGEVILYRVYASISDHCVAGAQRRKAT